MSLHRINDNYTFRCLTVFSFVPAKEPILKIVDSRLPVLNLFRSENMAFIKRALRSSILSHLALYSLRY